MSTIPTVKGALPFHAAFRGSFADIQSEAAEYLKAGGKAPYSKRSTLRGDGKLLTEQIVSFWPGNDPEHPIARTNLRLARHAKHPTCHTVTAVNYVRDDKQTVVSGVTNAARAGTLDHSLEFLAGKIDPNDSTYMTQHHENREEAGFREGPPFRSMQYLTHGQGAQKSVHHARNAVIEAAFECIEPSFDPRRMQKTKPSPTERLVLSQYHCPAGELSSKVEDCRSKGICIDSNVGLVATKLDQMKQVLSRDTWEPRLSIVDALNIHDKQVAQRRSTTSYVGQRHLPDGVTVSRQGDTLSLGDGEQLLRDVKLHYANPGSGATSKLYTVSTGHQPVTAVAPIITKHGKDYVMLVKQWQPGGGNGDQNSAWCLDFPRGPYNSYLAASGVSDIIPHYMPWHGVARRIRVLSDTGLMDNDAGLCDAQQSVIEAQLQPSRGFSMDPSSYSQRPDRSVQWVALNTVHDTVAEHSSSGGEVSLVLDSFATKIPQIQRAIQYQDTAISSGDRNWSHALPEVLKDPRLQLTKEAREIEDSFSRASGVA